MRTCRNDSDVVITPNFRQGRPEKLEFCRASCDESIGVVATSICDCRSSYIRLGPNFLLAAAIKGRDSRTFTLAVRRSTTKYSSSIPKRNSAIGSSLGPGAACCVGIHSLAECVQDCARGAVTFHPIFRMEHHSQSKALRITHAYCFDGPILSGGLDLQPG